MNEFSRWRLARRAGHLGLTATAAAAAVWLLGTEPTPNAQQTAPPASEALRLSATNHPPLPAERVWFAPAPVQGTRVAPALQDFARGVKLLENADAAAALPLVSNGALASTPMADYARYYTGVAQLALTRFDEAEASFAAVAARKPAGRLAEDVALRQAELRSRKADYPAAAAIYEQFAKAGSGSPALVWLRLGQSREATYDAAGALDAYRHVYYDYPLSPESSDAEAALSRLNALDADVETRMPQELKRAQVLYDARRWLDARDTYIRIRRKGSTEAEQAFGAVRAAACDVQMKEYVRPATCSRGCSPARRPWKPSSTCWRRPAASASATRRVDGARVRRRPPGEPVRRGGAEQPGDPLHPRRRRRARRAGFVEMLDKFPQGRFTERAAWRAGWWAFRKQQYAETVRIFERAAAAFPRSDYRPPWLYWTGRAHDQLGNGPTAIERYRLVATDYLNSYYGRLAWQALPARNEASVNALVDRPARSAATAERAADRAAPRPRAVPGRRRRGAVRAARLGRFAAVAGDDRARAEPARQPARRDQRDEARLSAVPRRRRRDAAGRDPEGRFPGGLLAAPAEACAQHGLDPYLVAALVAQESTFDPVIRRRRTPSG